VAVDSSGEAVAVWSRRPEWDGGLTPSYVETAAKAPSASAWSSAVRLSTQSFYAELPTLAMLPDGAAVAAWTGRPEPHGHETQKAVEVAIRPSAGAGWGAPVQLAGDVGEFGGGPAIAANPSGSLAAVWARETAAGEVTEASTGSIAGGWSAPSVLSLAGPMGERSIAVDGAGDAIAAWARWGDCSEVEVSAKPAGSGAWQPAHVLAGGSGACAYGPRVAFDAAGDAVVTWSLTSGPSKIAQAATQAAGGEWRPAVDISGPAEKASEPDLAVAANGSAVAIWEDEEGKAQGVSAAWGHAESGLWQAPVTLLAATAAPSKIGEFPSIAVDEAGDAAAAWDRWSGGGYGIEAATYSASSSTWAQPETLAAGSSGNNYMPAAATFAGGDASVVWEVQGSSASVEASGYFGAGPHESIQAPATARTGEPVTVSLSGADLLSTLGAVAWSFGDGTSASGEGVSHVFAKPGTYWITATSTDMLGASSSTSGAITVTSPPAATPTPPAPRILDARLSRRTLSMRAAARHGLQLTFALSEPATLTERLAKLETGSWRGHACVRRSAPRLAHSRRCSLARTLGKTVTVSLAAGSHRISLRGRFDGLALKPGVYALELAASNANGRSPATKLTFVLRG
jgi:hypothetical protein